MSETNEKLNLETGDVVFNTHTQHKYVVIRKRQISINEEFVCSKPHEDGDFSYLCGSNYCKCCS